MGAAEVINGRCASCVEDRDNYIRESNSVAELRELALVRNQERQRQYERQQREHYFLGLPIIGDYHSSLRKEATWRLASAWTRANNSRFIGVELEIESRDISIYCTDDCNEDCDNDCEGTHGRDEPDDNEACKRFALAALQAAHTPTCTKRKLFAEHDGSLTAGFELITQPMGLDDQTTLWTAVLQPSVLRGCYSHQTSTCGLHVHISRAGLAELTISKAIVAINDKSWTDLVHCVARRGSNGYSERKSNLASCKRVANMSTARYEMINTLNRATIEFRIFRGTLKLESLLAAIEFSNAVINWAAQTSARALEVRHFLAWLAMPANAHDTKNLRSMLATREPTQYKHLISAKSLLKSTTTTDTEN